MDQIAILVKVIVKQKLIANQKEFEKKLRWVNSNLQSPEKLKAYNKRLNGRLENQNQEDMENVEQDWQNIKAAILEAAKETIQMQPSTGNREWWDEECRKAIEEKNVARKKCLQRRTRATQGEYKKKDV